ncbi:MAG: anthranilate synthase component I family protein [Planctomycetota bacterium]
MPQSPRKVRPKTPRKPPHASSTLSLAGMRQLVRGDNVNVVPLVREIPTDTLTPVSAFLRLNAADAPAFMLESVDGGERVARYSFIGTQPYATLVVRDGMAAEETATRRTPLEGSPLTAIAQRMAGYRPAELAGLPRFTGGAVGYVGYDCIRYIEPTVKLPQPDTDDARLLLVRDLVAFDHVKQRMVLIANAMLDSTSSASHAAAHHAASDALDRMEAQLRQPAAAERLLHPAADHNGNLPDIAVRSGMTGEQYQAGVRRLKHHIREGDIFQAVLSNRFEVDLPAGADAPFRVYRTLRSINPSPYMFFIDTGYADGAPVAIGASPEMLVRVEDGVIETRPIAGTRPRGATEDDDRRNEANLLASVKERAEHVMLVDLGRNDVGRVAAPGTVHVPQFMTVERYSHVMHIVSTVRGRLARGQSVWDAFAACFPAGTVSGAPKIRAMQLLAGLEPLPRGLYSGAIVYQGFSGNLDSAITIRSLTAIKPAGGKAVARFQAGAGIVADSRPQAEWDEVLAKSGAMRNALQIATAGASVGTVTRKKGVRQ